MARPIPTIAIPTTTAAVNHDVRRRGRRGAELPVAGAPAAGDGGGVDTTSIFPESLPNLRIICARIGVDRLIRTESLMPL
jgi:hypothetical protein